MPKWTTTASAMFMLTWEHLIRTQFSSESYARSWFWNVIKGTKCHKMKIFGKVASSRTRAEKIQDKSGALYNTIRWSVSCFSHVWLCDPMKCSPPGSSVHEISQASILEWVAISFSRGSNSHLLHWQADTLQLSHEGSLSQGLAGIKCRLFLFQLQGLWDLSSPTRDWTLAIGSDSAES